MLKRLAISLALICLTSASLSAHDYWLQPATYFPKIGKKIEVRVHVGDNYTSEIDRAFQKKLTPSFELYSKGTVVDLAASSSDGKKPFGSFTAKKSGTHIVTMQRGWATIELKPKQFKDYLEHEGLKHIAEERKRSGEENTVGRERYRRYIKAIVQVGDRSDDLYRKKLGHKLEIIPLENPSEKSAGDSMKFQVLFDGKPLADSQFAAYHRLDKKVDSQHVTTNDKGVAEIKLTGKGEFLVKLIYMRRAKNVKDIDWESYWASLTFAVR